MGAGPDVDAPPRLLSYDLAADRWSDHGPVPGPQTFDRHLSTVGRSVLVYSGSDEFGEVADLVFDPERSRWTELPDDPMPRTYDRLVVRVGDQLVLTGSSSESSGKLAARLDAASSEWIPIPEAPVRGFQLMRTDRGPLLNAHFTDSLSWLLDPRSWTWSALPQSAGETNNLSGVLDRDRASYDIPNSAGGVASVTPLVVYDRGTQAAVTIPAPPGREGTYGESSTALGRDLFVFGGQRWTDDGVGELVGDAMLWTAPLP